MPGLLASTAKKGIRQKSSNDAMNGATQKLPSAPGTPVPGVDTSPDPTVVDKEVREPSMANKQRIAPAPGMTQPPVAATPVAAPVPQPGQPTVQRPAQPVDQGGSVQENPFIAAVRNTLANKMQSSAQTYNPRAGAPTAIQGPIPEQRPGLLSQARQ